ncbi:hypothetical protein RF11_04295 [Thelohanellus kitauei]|uniref:Uncharacterized protein n=1 Tax=Thelohanellus kitauei TaxID=669202 RepID=A0A0C2N1G9_THEKT|nr:hypothetical protein RF11_04295 [Thelohanellus kitauei]
MLQNSPSYDNECSSNKNYNCISEVLSYSLKITCNKLCTEHTGLDQHGRIGVRQSKEGPFVANVKQHQLSNNLRTHLGRICDAPRLPEDFRVHRWTRQALSQYFKDEIPFRTTNAESV